MRYSTSPLLFNIIMDEIIKAVQVLKGYKMRDRNVNVLCYADDAILLVESEYDLQRLLHEINCTAKLFNMTISAQKQNV